MTTGQTTSSFSEWLAAALHKKRMTGGELSERLRISRAAVYHYLGGKRVPDHETAKKIATGLGLSSDALPRVEWGRVGRRSKSAPENVVAGDPVF